MFIYNIASLKKNPKIKTDFISSAMLLLSVGVQKSPCHN